MNAAERVPTSPGFDAAPHAEEGTSWESFYQSYRKPGYIAGYEILHKLGGGVFGVVFKARKESIGKAYAIKFLKIDDPTVKAQVLRELDQVALFAQVDHPNLVSIEDKGDVDGIPFIVMGYAGEETLRTRLEEGRLSEEDALRVFVQVARGVQALHDHSLIHFDLKPANVFLKGDIARVGDYGLSKLVSESRMSLSFGRGTPYYMAPEMLQRRGDQRSDIYSLGVILFECLSGEVPFRGENEWEVLKGHEEKPVVFPDSIGEGYRRVLARMLAKKPEERYASVEEVLRDMRAPGRRGESIVLDLGVPGRSEPKTSRTEPVPVVPAVRDGLFGSLMRALVIALLLPARVLGLGLGRGLQALIRIPAAILGFLGKVSLVVIGGIILFLIAAFAWLLVVP